MNDIIHLLPDSVANQIAAGEVIQRPSSVIKELVENAVDAGASTIDIIVKDGGRTLIQVIDDGKGMTETDARMAFERHATSKITEAADIYTLTTMGFRGEALPSICAIAQVELRTNTGEGPKGTCLLISGSKVESQQPCVCSKGSNFMVKNLFFNTPARRRFMKSDKTELNCVMREFERLALVNHHLRMSIDTGNRRLELRAGTFRQRIEDLWKNQLNNQLLPIEVDTSLVKISGYVSRPEFCRKQNALQFMIVNGRNMAHPYFAKAVNLCYEPLTASGTKPCFFLRFEVDPASIDVNVHPTKSEIKFSHEEDIWKLLRSAVKTALGKFSAVPSIDFDEDALDSRPAMQGDYVPMPSSGHLGSYNPFRQSGQSSRPAAPAPRNWDDLYADFMQAARQKEPVPAAPVIPEMETAAPIGDSLPVCMQFARKYILTTTSDGLLVIDQHRAHVKVLYHRCMENLSRETPGVQRLIFPDEVTLNLTQQTALELAEAEIRRMGFVVEYLEEDRWQIVSVPSKLLTPASHADTLRRLLDSVSEDMEWLRESGSQLSERIALLMARASAIQRGQKLSDTEMQHLLGELFSLPDPAYTPTGNSIFITVTENRLRQLLG